MIRIEVLTATHVLQVRGVDPLSGVCESWIDEAYAAQLEAEGGFAAVDEQGAVAIGGFTPIHPGRAEVWAIIGRRWRRHAKTVTALVDAEITASGLRRVEAQVMADFPGGRSWIERLGFTPEGVLRSAWIDGRDVVMYSRIQQEA